MPDVQGLKEMKCNKPFIHAYDRLFRFLAEKGYDQLSDFWSLLSDAILGRLRFLVKTKGMAGMVEYWSDTLSSEGAKFTITYSNSEEPLLTLRIWECPSLAELDLTEEGPSDIYCDHCFAIYPQALKELGYLFTCLKVSEIGCLIRISKCETD